MIIVKFWLAALYYLYLPLGEGVHQCRAVGPAVLCRWPERPDGRVPGAGPEEGRGAEDPPGPEGGAEHHRWYFHLHHHCPRTSACWHVLDGRTRWSQVKWLGLNWSYEQWSYELQELFLLWNRILYFILSPGLLQLAPRPQGGCLQASARPPEGPRHRQTAQDPWGPLITVLTALRLPAALTGLLLASPGKHSLHITVLLARCCACWILPTNTLNLFTYNSTQQRYWKTKEHGAFC